MNTLNLALLPFVFFALMSPAVPADPQAPGARKLHDSAYVGYTGAKWKRDYGILAGTCDATAVGALLGRGAAVATRVSHSSDPPVAVIVGTALGALVGANVDANFDSGDRGCMGHTLELAGERETVAWSNARTGVRYQVTPTRNFKDRSKPCREFTTLISSGKRTNALMGVACRGGAGEWTIRS
ncbi:MAG TPA: RT0821/Lpp0805 family surface protein [Burkholderiales bacterium]|nr:RT0821/Lpp0805 family surface protein [Burkholderiales bacterium]